MRHEGEYRRRLMQDLKRVLDQSRADLEAAKAEVLKLNRAAQLNAIGRRYPTKRKLIEAARAAEAERDASRSERAALREAGEECSEVIRQIWHGRPGSLRKGELAALGEAWAHLKQALADTSAAALAWQREVEEKVRAQTFAEAARMHQSQREHNLAAAWREGWEAAQVPFRKRFIHLHQDKYNRKAYWRCSECSWTWDEGAAEVHTPNCCFATDETRAEFQRITEALTPPASPTSEPAGTTEPKEETLDDR